MTSTPQASGHVDHAAGHERGGEVGGLLRRAALGVDGGVGDRLGEAGAEPGRAADVEGLLADLADAAGDDLADGRRVDARPLDGGLLGGGQQVGRVDGGEPAATATNGGADGFDDHDIRHGRNLSGAGAAGTPRLAGVSGGASAPTASSGLEHEQQGGGADEGHEDRAEVELVEGVDRHRRGEPGHGSGEQGAEDADGDRAEAARASGRAHRPLGQGPGDAARRCTTRGSPSGGDGTGAGGQAAERPCEGCSREADRPGPGGLRRRQPGAWPGPRRRPDGPPLGWRRRGAMWA